MTSEAVDRAWGDEAGSERRGAEAYLEALERRGLPHFLDGGEGLTLDVRRVDGRPIPLVVNDGRRGKPSFTSPTGHYLDYPTHEIARGSRWLSRPLLGLVLSPLSLALAWGRLDRVVYVNHWLLVGGPPLRLGASAIRRLIRRLVDDYPDHALVFSGIVPGVHPTTVAALVGAGARAVQSRVVHLLDSSESLRGGGQKRVRANRNAGRRLFDQNLFRRTTDRALLHSRADRLEALYGELYLDKHPGGLNPRYRRAFFELLLTSELFSVAGWTRDGDIDAFNVQWITDGTLCWSLCGVEMDRVRVDRLFQLVMADDFIAAEKQGLVVNWGGGNGRFKRLRGARPSLEYDFVVDHHLGPRRRLPWWLLQRLRMWKNGAPRVPEPQR